MLPAALLDQILGRLAVRYGMAWSRMWEGLQPDAVRADWGTVLDGFSAADVAHALQHLPADRPPNVAQFRDLCRRAPRQDLPRLDAPRTPPPADMGPRIRAAASGIGRRHADPKAWARELQRREAAGERLAPHQRREWRAALAAAAPAADDAAL